jgi:hypothetical protein
LYFVIIFLKGPHRIDSVEWRITTVRSLAIVVGSGDDPEQQTQQ